MSPVAGTNDPSEVPNSARVVDTPEYGLFVIWEQARRDEREILADLARRFRLIQAYEISWTPELVRRNYARFYSDLDVRGVYHEINKGNGPFVAATVIDPHPVHDQRDTSRGPRVVNVNFHDAKLEYRDRIGHLGLHCSETAAETRRDLVMLLGLDVCQLAVESSDEPWDGRVERVALDIAGANGWASESDLLRSLNASAPYVVVGAPAGNDTSLFGGDHVPHLITNDYHSIHTVMNARAVLGHPPPGGGRFTVEVGGRRVPVSIQQIGDGFIDPNWAQQCLDHRVLDGGRFYRPSEPDDLATRCYLALMRQRHLTDDDRSSFRALADDECQSLERTPTAAIGRAEANSIIDCYLSKRGYVAVVPRDPTVGNRVGVSGFERLARSGQAAFYVLTRGVGGYVRTGWLTARDALVFRAPALRKLVRRWTDHS